MSRFPLLLSMRCLCALMVVATVFMAGCMREKDRLDAQVRELCAKDGGIKVYEKVVLPPEKFDEFGVVRVPIQSAAKEWDEFFYEWNITYYKKGNPEMWRGHFLLIRRIDKKLLGESVTYSRRGGDFPGPWHESSYTCLESGDVSQLKKEVFKSSTQAKNP